MKILGTTNQKEPSGGTIVEVVWIMHWNSSNWLHHAWGLRVIPVSLFCQFQDNVAKHIIRQRGQSSFQHGLEMIAWTIRSQRDFTDGFLPLSLRALSVKFRCPPPPNLYLAPWPCQRPMAEKLLCSRCAKLAAGAARFWKFDDQNNIVQERNTVKSIGPSGGKEMPTNRMEHNMTVALRRRQTNIDLCIWTPRVSVRLLTAL